MKCFLVVVIAVVVGLSAVPAKAQTPYLQVYFDDFWTVTVKDTCPGFGVFDTLYVVGHNWNNRMTAMEYKIVYPPEIVFVADIIQTANSCQLKTGASPAIVAHPDGISVVWRPDYPCGWPDGFNAFLVNAVQILWNCEGCAGQLELPIINAHGPAVPTPPYNYEVLGVAGDLSNNDIRWEVFGVGLTAFVCATETPPVPVEESTWGGIKALYRD
jgi:hypothetical protein